MVENKLKDESLEKVSGGNIVMVRRSNFCPKCRDTEYSVQRMENGIEYRECNTCHHVYEYRKR